MNQNPQNPIEAIVKASPTTEDKIATLSGTMQRELKTVLGKFNRDDHPAMLVNKLRRASNFSGSYPVRNDSVAVIAPGHKHVYLVSALHAVMYS